MRSVAATCLFLALACGRLAAEPSVELDAQFAEARANYDLGLAEALLPQMAERAQSAATRDATLAYAATALLVAELRRGRYEHEGLERKARRALGRSIDTVAKDGLDALQPLPETSARLRLEADLLATMIRSKFQGMKYQPRLEHALERALELDENNADAWVSYARRPLFARPEQGGDLALAIERLGRALAIEPDDVQALLYRGTAYYKLGDAEHAAADWDRAIALNPASAGALERLKTIEMPDADED